jgi:tetratricopeptide (TPR) repeat protein
MTTLRLFTITAVLSTILCVCAGAAFAQRAATARPSPPSIGLTYSLGASAVAAEAPPRSIPAPAEGDDDDPAYAGYKKAYELILDERWDEARKAFRELTKKYPDSEYRDDAEYWIAYSYRETDYDRAMDLYKKFVKDYKKSTYFDDALADMDQLMARSMAVTLPRHAVGVNMATPPASPAPISPEDPESGLSMTTLPTPALAPMMKMRHLERMLRRGTPVPGVGWTYDNDDLDEETRIRLEAVNAIGMTREDEKGFLTLKSLAVNPGEKQVVRIAAIEAMSNYRKHESLPVLVEIARNDTSDEMQLFAIDYIGQAARDKEKAFDALLTLYTALPAAKVEKRKMVFYAIAGIGNDKAVDFLSTVARSNDDYELRREAIYYLGSIGGEKARDVLIEVLEKKPSR